MSAAPRLPVFCAIDTTDLDLAGNWVRAAAAAGFGVKLGKEFFTAHGPRDVRRIVPDDVPLFLDLKFHDIPNTVAGAVRAASQSMRPFMLTIHASGASAMMKAAAEAAAKSGDARPLVLAVTVLTSLDASDLAAIGVSGNVGEQVQRLGRLAKASGCDGSVCAATEIGLLRDACGHDYRLVVPGIRPAGSDVGDQKRVMTPADAFKAGADWLVIGRPITGAADPARAAKDIAAEIATAKAAR